MKKTITTIAVCAILGIVIYAGYYFLRDSLEPVPDPIPIDVMTTTEPEQVENSPEPTTKPANDWTGITVSPNPLGTTYNTQQPVNDDEEQYPKVVKDDEDEVVINFTDPEKGKTPSPDAAKSDKSSSIGTAASQDGQKTADSAVSSEPSATPKPTATPAPKATATPNPASTPKPSATPKPAATPKPSATPKPESNNTRSDGAVYDPVFGWVIPSKTVGEIISSDKSIDEMVGYMGEDG